MIIRDTADTAEAEFICSQILMNTIHHFNRRNTMRHTYAFAHNDVLVFTKIPKVGDLVVIQNEDNTNHAGIINAVTNLRVEVIESNKDNLNKDIYYYVMQKYVP